MAHTAVLQTDTRHRIIEAMMQIAAKEGFERATTQQISSQAGVSEGIIYHYFRSKEELYLNMIREKAAEFRERMVSELSGVDSPDKKLERLIDSHVEFVTAGNGFFRILFNRTGGKPIMFKQALKTGIMPYAEYIEGILKEGIDRGQFRSVDPKITAFNLIGMMQISLIPILLGEVPYTAQQAKENIKNLFLGGLLK